MTTVRPSHGNLRRDEARERAALLSNVAYDVHLDLTSDGDTFASRTTVSFDCARDGASTFLDLTAREAAVEGADADFDGARVHLRGLRAGRNEVVVGAHCDYMRTGSGLHRFVDPVDDRPYLHTQFEPFDAHRVLACFDQPDLKGPFTLRVDTPSDWVVVSNNEGVRDGGTWTFPATPKLSTYLYAVVAGPFHAHRAEHNGTPLGLYCRQSLAKHLDVDELLEVTRQGLDFFGEYFDYPYPFGKYDQLFVPEFSAGAMEHPGCVTFNESMVYRSRVTTAQLEGRANTILHEMAHMWFGDLVTMRWWDDLWLNESFATYMASVAIVAATRFEGGWARFAAGTKTSAYAQDQLPSTHPISADIVDTEATRTHFDGITYSKGASVLRQLAAWVGDEAFRDGCRAYFRSHEWDNAELKDFLAALEQTSGRDLAPWASAWLQTSGVNTLRPAVVRTDGRYASVAIGQEGEPARPHRVAVGLYDDGKRRTRVELDVTGGTTVVDALAGEAPADLLLVNDDDLSYAKVRFDEHSLEWLLKRMSSLGDPLARSLCWAAVWDMVRDAELGAGRYVHLVAAHAHREDELGAAARLFGQASTACDAYADPARRDAYRAALAARARQSADASEPGSEAQLVWTRIRLSDDDSAEGVAVAKGLLDGSASVDGLSVDTDLRWMLVTSLLERGHAPASLADDEAARDATDIGQRRALGAKASTPHAAAKAEAWDLLTTEPAPPLATLRAVAVSFYVTGQDDLLRPYVARYFDALGGWWRDRDPDVAQRLTGGLYPSTLVEQATIDATTAALDGAGLPAPARRFLIEGRDRLQRAARARACDARA